MICRGARNVEVEHADAQNGNQTWRSGKSRAVDDCLGLSHEYKDL